MDKLEALEYLADADLNHVNEWVQAGMYNAMRRVVKSEKTNFSSGYLDNLIKQAEQN